MKYSDISTNEVSKWKQWRDGFFQDMSISSNLVHKIIWSRIFNELTSDITDLMTNQGDPTFKDNVIKTIEELPQTAQNNEVFFQLVFPG